MAEVGAQPAWNTTDGGQAWNRVWIGGIPMPGIATVTDVEVAQDIDVKKAKGNDGATTTDNGVEPSKWTVELRINASQYQAFLAVLPQVNPRRPGAAKLPLEIRHPLVNMFGITQCRTQSIAIESPTARSGMTIKIKCLEWFPAPKKTKSKSTDKPKNVDNSKWTGDPNALARDMQQNATGLPPPGRWALENL